MISHHQNQSVIVYRLLSGCRALNQFQFQFQLAQLVDLIQDQTLSVFLCSHMALRTLHLPLRLHYPRPALLTHTRTYVRLYAFALKKFTTTLGCQRHILEPVPWLYLLSELLPRFRRYIRMQHLHPILCLQDKADPLSY